MFCVCPGWRFCGWVHSANVTRRATSLQTDEGERGPSWLGVTVAELCTGAGTKAIGPHVFAPGDKGIVSKSIPQTQPQTLGDARVHTPSRAACVLTTGE